MAIGDFWRERGFEPIPLETYLKLSALVAVATVLVVFLCALLGNLAPLGVWGIVITEYQRHKGVMWIGPATFRRESHPKLFKRGLAQGYVISMFVVLIGLYQATVPLGAV